MTAPCTVQPLLIEMGIGWTRNAKDPSILESATISDYVREIERLRSGPTNQKTRCEECNLLARCDNPLCPNAGDAQAPAITDEMVEAAAKVVHPLAFDTDEFGDYLIMPIGRREAKKRAREILTAALVVPYTPSEPAQHPVWRPIETAPRDGTICDLMLKGGGRVTDQWWDDEDKSWCGLGDDMFSHWMPAPYPIWSTVPSTHEGGK
jgi:hypothetical protein